MKLTGSLIVLLTCAILGNGQVSFLEPDCGVSSSSVQGRNSRARNSRARNSKYRIIGGVQADMFGNPWMAWISSTVHCGGSLITSRFVLSAAHCITGHPTTVTLGVYDRSRSSPNAIRVPVDLQIPHRHYTNTKRDIKNDIGLFRLARTVQYTDFIRPICLPTNYNPLAQTTHLTATGWGTTEHGVLSSMLKTTTLTQLNRRSCSSKFRTNVDISQICAGASNSHTCSGDSGGPISAIYSIAGRNRVVQLGIVSYGDEHCRTDGVYTNVMHFMGWITNVVRRVGGQKTPAPTQRPNHNKNINNNNNNKNNNNKNTNDNNNNKNNNNQNTNNNNNNDYNYEDEQDYDYYYPNDNTPVTNDNSVYSYVNPVYYPVSYYPSYVYYG